MAIAITQASAEKKHAKLVSCEYPYTDLVSPLELGRLWLFRIVRSLLSRSLSDENQTIFRYLGRVLVVF